MLIFTFIFMHEDQQAPTDIHLLAYIRFQCTHRPSHKHTNTRLCFVVHNTDRHTVKQSVSICTNLCIYAYICIYIYVYIYMYKYTYKYTYIHMFLFMDG